MMKNNKNVYLSLALIVFLTQGIVACSSTSNTSRYSQKQDSAPTFEYGDLDYVEPNPVFEPYNVWTSRPYKVNNRYYTPLMTGKGFEQEGYASWYGQKFHGHKTANGETFDMFQLTAAHTTLPLPSYVRVTNTENNNTVIVRVNDRGPFHDQRIIDLSYAAAKKLGFRNKGVAKVKIEVIHVDESGLVTIGKQPQDTLVAKNQAPTLSPADVNVEETITESVTDDIKLPQLFVQVLALTDANKAQDLARGLANLLQLPTHIPKLENIYKLQVGPLENEQSAKKVIQHLSNIGFENAFTVELTPQ
ncbi:septal ring lytic transglycosylase RlpA family protein [Glaciecola sp. 1036]|uniref:septal ring lytic transglycosylase RlpA family protein n=1 Tax=Alteromonadaceae TaxID=72275 RepID=UPI003D00768E